jgi:uncharacterized damage-inducible protein DinB
MSPIRLRLLAGVAMLTLLAYAQSVPPELGKGWLPEFEHASNQLNALANATPADKFGWRPAAGIRSVGEVYMHVAIGKYFLLGQAGVQIPPEAAAIMKDGEKAVTAKADIVKCLKDSQAAVRAAYPKADLRKKVKFLTGDTTADGVFLRLLVHNHEHMGQSIAYARSIGVVPPWSQPAAR